MEKTLLLPFPNRPLISLYGLQSPNVVKLSPWQRRSLCAVGLQSSSYIGLKAQVSSKSKPRVVCLFGDRKGKGKEGGDLSGKDAAIKALEQALGGKKNPFTKWVDRQKTEADAGGGDDEGGDDKGGGGWSSGRGGSGGYRDEGDPEDVFHTTVAYLAFAYMYLWMLFRKDMAKVYRAVRRWFRDNVDWDEFIDWSIYYFDVFRYYVHYFFFGKEDDEDWEPEFICLPQIVAAFKLFWDCLYNDDETQRKDCKEFETLLKDLLKHKRHGNKIRKKIRRM